MNRVKRRKRIAEIDPETELQVAEQEVEAEPEVWNVTDAERDKQERRDALADSLSELADALFKYTVIPLVIVLLITNFVVFLAWIPTDSMAPTIPKNSLRLALPQAYAGDREPQRGDIIFFRHQDHSYNLCKRVIATEGETISFAGGDVYIDGELLVEDYVPEHSTFAFMTKTFQVPEGCLFVMGDNRLYSNDSRYWTHPFVYVKDVSGRTIR